ncbi:MAG: hypothetical protein FJY97_08930 [candidate division Zixibacteria bacterium]|nr:hypothetical protein [candidate division Zixibacteria bacterium]
MSKLEQVNTTDILDAIRLGCRTMSGVFNADDRDIPFFGSQVWPDARLSFSSAHSEAHVPGRHLNALLNAEGAAGIEIDEDAVEKHARAAFFSYEGPVALPLNRERIDGPLTNFIPHNIREGFHALYALALYRRSDRAQEVAASSIRAIFYLWDPVKGWNRAAIEGMGLKLHDSTFIIGVARCIGPLVKYYRATGYGPALELALRLKEKAIAEFFLPDGGYDRETFGTHTHSTTCVMSSLAQLADLTGDGPLIERVRTFYNNGLFQIRDALGWVIENSGDQANPDFGEINNTGDILETALILGRWGYTECFQDAERILRGHLLPSQLRDTSFISEPPNPDGEDGRRRMADRHLGAFGFPAPYGHLPLGRKNISFNLDIVGGGVASLCEAYREIATFDRSGHRVHLFFDHETPDIKVTSPYTQGRLRVRIKRPAPLWVRIPGWVAPDAIKVQGAEEPLRPTGGYLYFAQPPVNREIVFDFPLTKSEITLNHRTRSIRVRLVGDAVEAMEDVGAEFTYFEKIF